MISYPDHDAGMSEHSYVSTALHKRVYIGQCWMFDLPIEEYVL